MFDFDISWTIYWLPVSIVQRSFGLSTLFTSFNIWKCLGMGPVQCSIHHILLAVNRINVSTGYHFGRMRSVLVVAKVEWNGISYQCCCQEPISCINFSMVFKGGAIHVLNLQWIHPIARGAKMSVTIFIDADAAPKDVVVTARKLG